MKKLLFFIFVNSLFLFNLSAYEKRAVGLYDDGNIGSLVRELTVQDNQALNVIGDKFRIFEIIVKNNFDKDIYLPLSYYYLNFVKMPFAQKNIFAQYYKEIKNNIDIRKLIFYYSLIILPTYFTTHIVLADAQNLKTAFDNLLVNLPITLLVAAVVGVTTGLIGWFFSLRQLNNSLEDLNFLNMLKSDTLNYDNYIKENNSYRVAPGAEFKDYLFVPINSEFDLGGSLIYLVD